MSDLFPATNAIFHDPDVYAAEQARVFGEGWVFLATEDQLPASGALHTPSGLVAQRSAQGVSARDAEGEPMAVERAGFFWFACPGTPRETLQESLGPMHGVVTELGELASELLFEVRMTIEGNWKLVVSGAIEDYHLPFVHGTSVNPWRTEPAHPTLVLRGHSSYVTSAELGAVERGLHTLLLGSASVRREFENILIYPNLLLIRLWGLTHVTLFVPRGSASTLRVTRIYGHTPAGSPFDPRRWTRSAIAGAFKQGVQVTFREDQRIVEEAQRGTLAGRRMLRGPAHAEEARVEHFLAETGRRVNS